MMQRFAFAATLALGLIASPVRADIYAFTDASGVPHFSNVPVDGRYQLLIATPADPATAPAGDQRLLARSGEYDAIIEHAAKTQAVEPSLLRAVIAVESGFDSRAVSPKGAVGLMQLMPKTAERYGAANPFDPAQNINAGAKYLRDLIKRYGRDLELALAAYNAGEDAVERSGRRIPAFKETALYVPRVLRVYKSLMEQRQVT
jgi:soluble lytic murein transglycosylase-like protein